jgi:hypothetical protein
MRYFRADADTYERVRAAIDAVNGWPDAGTRTAIEPAVTAPRDALGRVLLAVQFWSAIATSDQLAQLEEISEGEYLPAQPSVG